MIRQIIFSGAQSFSDGSALNEQPNSDAYQGDIAVAIEAISEDFQVIRVDFRINETRQTDAVSNRTYRGTKGAIYF